MLPARQHLVPFNQGHRNNYHHPLTPELYKSTLKAQKHFKTNNNNPHNKKVQQPRSQNHPFSHQNVLRDKNTIKGSAYINPKELRSVPSNSKKIYVCFSSKTLTEGHLQKGFAQFGKVTQIEICTKRKKGAFTYGFIEFLSIGATQEALKARKITVSGVSVRIKPMEKIPDFNESQVQKCLKNHDLEHELNFQQLLSQSDERRSERGSQLLLIEKLKRQNILREVKKTAKNNSRIQLIVKLRHKVEEQELLRFNSADPYRYLGHRQMPF